ncbi:MAG: WD40/YVTN/BNR-like repeat-containing protein [Gemmatimonadales bacterium]
MRTPALLLIALLPTGVAGQNQPARMVPPIAAEPPGLNGTAELRAIRDLKWRWIGPANQAGRIPMMVGVPGDRSTYYVGSAAGGLFKTTNGGVTFEALFDDQSNASIGDLAIAPSNPNILYLGTGEGNPRNSASIGDGVYKSVDGGRTWKKIGLENTEKIPRIRIDPQNPDVVYVCALGRTWGPNPERGLFKSTDGGKTWRKVLYHDDLTGCADVDIDPTNANIVWVGTHRHQRWPWYFTSGGGATGVYKSADGGETWTQLSGKGNGRGLPEGDMDRVGVSVHRANPDVVYVVSETKTEGQLWRTEDGGRTWETVNRERNINFRPFYYSDLRADPRNPNVVFSLSGGLYKSQDGGRTFQTVRSDIHGDHQAMWIDPTDPSYILEGSDGGWQVSYDGGRTFEVINTISFAQFYHLNLDLAKPYNICGGLQDNGHWCGPSRTLSNQGNRKNAWVTISGGDGFFAVPDLAQPHLVYSASQGGNIVLTDTRTGDQRSIHPYPRRVGSAGDSLAEHKYRFNWNAAIALNPSDPRTVYFGGNVVFRSRNYGQSWDVISPDLTTNDKKKQGSSGGPIVTDNTAAEFHSTILTIAPSPKDPKVIWVGTDDGYIQVTRDGGTTWTNTVKNIRDLPPNAWISTIDASPHEAGTALVAASHWQTGDYTPYAYLTRDHGQTWTRIAGNLPARGWVHVVRQDPKNPNLLYTGTEFGIYASWNTGRQWHNLRNGISAAPVRDLLVHPRDNDLVIATHGRGLYILDDLTPLQQLGQAMTSELTLFDPRPAVRWVMWNSDANLGQKVWRGENPPFGAVFSYFVRDTVRQLRFTIKDSDGRVVRTLRDSLAVPGVHRQAWDLRYDALPPGEMVTAGGGPGGGGFGGGGGGFGFGGGGPWVVPGNYTVTLTVAGKEMAKPFTVELDPRATVSLADLVAQRDAALELRELSARVNRVVGRANNLMQQLTNLGTTLRQNAPTERAAIDETRGALEELRAFRDTGLARPLAGLGYRQYPRLREEVQSLSGSVNRSLNRPTDAQLLRKGELEAETSAAEAKLNGIVNGRIARVNALLKNLPHIVMAGGGIS